MVIDNTTKYDEIWNSVYSKLSFSPSCEYRGHSLNVALPFHINEYYSVYTIEDHNKGSCNPKDKDVACPGTV